jgi:hypothetical protein
MNTRNGVIKHGEPAEECKKKMRDFSSMVGESLNYPWGIFQQTMFDYQRVDRHVLGFGCYKRCFGT